MLSRPARLLLAAALAVALATPGGAQEGDWGEEDGNREGYQVQVEAEASSVSLETFQDGLSPYGEWVQSGYGTAWRPRAAAGWRPYYYGRWEWTNEGWLWVSEEPFGWATYHYGRWAHDGGLGWIWVPGYQWAPAWVSWRFGGDVVGWAPLAPGLSLYVTSYGFVDAWWTFVPSARFCGSPVWGMAYAPSRSYQLYGVTSPAPPRPLPGGRSGSGAGGMMRPPAGSIRRTPAWGGPPPRYIEERIGRPITASRIVAEPRPGALRGRSGEIGVYRPEALPRSGSMGRGPSAERWTSPLAPPASTGRSRPMMGGGGPSERSAPPPAAASPTYQAPSRSRGEWERPAPRSMPPPTAPRYEQRASPPPAAAPRHEPRYEPRSAPPPRAAPQPRGAAPSGGRGGPPQPRRSR
jgi:hypothetical protein